MEQRTLWDKPTITNEGEEYEEKNAGWFELFLDLVFVAAASNVADTFKEDTSWTGFWGFVVVFMLFQDSWRSYMFLRSRFQDESLLHSVQLFFFLLGSSLMVINASGFRYPLQFTIGWIIQRASLISFNLWIFALVKMARATIMCVLLRIILWDLMTDSVAVALGTAACLIDAQWAFKTAWTFSVVEAKVTPLVFVFLAQCTPLVNGPKLVKLNIEHATDRAGDFVMLGAYLFFFSFIVALFIFARFLVLGESVVTAVINYHNLQDKVKHQTGGVYPVLGAMAMGLLLTFSLGLIYYHVAPDRSLHALRRSYISAILFLHTNVVLNQMLLLVGVGLKFCFEAVLNETHMTKTQFWIFFLAEAACFLCMLFIRMLHYYKRPTEFFPRGVQNLMTFWWAFIGLSWVPPILSAVLLTIFSYGDPFVVLGCGVFSVGIIVISESIVVEILYKWYELPMARLAMCMAAGQMVDLKKLEEMPEDMTVHTDNTKGMAASRKKYVLGAALTGFTPRTRYQYTVQGEKPIDTATGSHEEQEATEDTSLIE